MGGNSSNCFLEKKVTLFCQQIDRSGIPSHRLPPCPLFVSCLSGRRQESGSHERGFCAFTFAVGHHRGQCSVNTTNLRVEPLPSPDHGLSWTDLCLCVSHLIFSILCWKIWAFPRSCGLALLGRLLRLEGHTPPSSLCFHYVPNILHGICWFGLWITSTWIIRLEIMVSWSSGGFDNFFLGFLSHSISSPDSYMGISLRLDLCSMSWLVLPGSSVSSFLSSCILHLGMLSPSSASVALVFVQRWIVIILSE